MHNNPFEFTYAASAQHVCFNKTMAQPMYCTVSKRWQHAHICQGYSDRQTLDGFLRCVAAQRSYITGQTNLLCYYEQLHAQATILVGHCLVKVTFVFFA